MWNIVHKRYMFLLIFFKQSNITGVGEKIRIGKTNNAGFHVSLSYWDGFSLNKFNLWFKPSKIWACAVYSLFQSKSKHCECPDLSRLEFADWICRVETLLQVKYFFTLLDTCSTIQQRKCSRHNTRYLFHKTIFPIAQTYQKPNQTINPFEPVFSFFTTWKPQDFLLSPGGKKWENWLKMG